LLLPINSTTRPSPTIEGIASYKAAKI